MMEIMWRPEQDVNCIGTSSTRGVHESSPPLLVSLVFLDLEFEQQMNDLFVVALRSTHEGRDSLFLRSVDVGVASQKKVHYFFVTCKKNFLRQSLFLSANFTKFLFGAIIIKDNKLENLTSQLFNPPNGFSQSLEIAKISNLAYVCKSCYATRL